LFGLRGLIYHDLEEYNKAIKDYHKAIELKPDDANVYNNRGNTYIELQDYNNAIKDYNKAIELNSNFSEAYNNRGFSYKNITKFNNAIKDYDKAIEISPEVAIFYTNRGSVFFELNKYNEAIEDFNKAIELEPSDPILYSNRGSGYYGMKNHKKAIKDFNKAIELKSNLGIAYSNRGGAFFDLGEYRKAFNDFNLAIKLEPTNVTTYNNRGSAFFKLGLYEESELDFTKSIELNSKNHYAFKTRGIIYSEIDKNDLAIKDFNESVKLNPNDDFIFFLKAESFVELEEYEKAITDYKIFIEKTDDNYWKEQAKSEIERLQEILSDPFFKIIEKAVERIQNELLYKGESITHYTNMGGAKALLLNEDSLFRLSEAHYMNDTSEGEQLNKAVGDVKLTIKNKLPFIAKPFLGSFVGDDMDNYLNLWRMYANTNGNDGCGCAITLSRKEFLKTISQFIPSPPKKKDEEMDEKEVTIQSSNSFNSSDFECYCVAYLNKKNKCIDSDHSDAINDALDEIRAALVGLNKNAKNKLDSAYERLSSIAYLFKSEEYQYEKEIRIVIKDSANAEHVVVDDAEYFSIPRVYHNIGNIHSALKSVTIGPKVERAGEWQTVFNYSFKQNPAVKNEVEVYISKLPYK